MEKQYTHTQIAFNIWLYTSLVFTAGALVIALWNNANMPNAVIITMICFLCSFVGSLPALLILIPVIYLINDSRSSFNIKVFQLLVSQLLVCNGYGSLLYFFMSPGSLSSSDFEMIAYSVSALFASCAIATAINYKCIKSYFQQSTSTSNDSGQHNFPVEKIKNSYNYFNN